MAVPLFADSRIQKHYEELNDCREVVDYFLHQKPWADEYQNVPRLSWYLLLQSRFSDLQGRWLDISEPDFLEAIETLIESAIRGLDALEASLEPDQSLAPSIPPNLRQLVKEYEAAKDKKDQGKKIEELLWHHWELDRNRSLLKQDLGPNLASVQFESANILENIVALTSRDLPELERVSPDFLSSALKETLPPGDGRLVFGEEGESLEQTKEIFQKTLKKALVETGLEENRAEEVAHQAKRQLDDPEERLQLEKLRSALQQQSQYQDLVNFQEKRVNYLEGKVNLSAFAQGTEELQNKTAAALCQFIAETLNSEPVKEKLEKINVSESDLENIGYDIFTDVLSKTACSQDLHLWTLPEEEITKTIKEGIQESFAQNLRRVEITGIFSAIKNAFLPSKRLTTINQTITKIEQRVEEIPSSLISSLKVATIQNIGAANTAIEAGHPLGRIPETIKLMILKTESEELRGLTVEQLALRFQRLLIEGYGAGKDLTESQITSIKSLFGLVKSLEQFNPKLSWMLRQYSTHYTKLIAARGALSFFLQAPGYLLHLPWIYGKMWLIQGKIKQDWWELRIKPRIVSNLIKFPGLGGLFRFWYGAKPNEWGLFTPLPTRLKKKILEATLRKGVKTAGKVLTWLGKKLGKDVWVKLGQKLISKALVSVAPVVGIIVVFWPEIKGFLKRVGQALLLWFAGLIAWAAQHGPWVLGGFAVGFAGGIPAGIFAGKATFAATIAPLTAVLGPIGGPIAAGAVSIFAGLATWAATAGLFTALGYFAQGIWLSISSWFSSVFSSLFGAGVEMTTTTSVGAGLGGMNLVGVTAPILASTGAIIAGLYFYTQLVNTSSLLPPEGMEFLVGSKYIEIEKGVQVGEESDKDQFEDRYNLPNDICDPPAKTVYYQIGLKVSKDLTDIKITDKTTRTGEYGSVLVQEKSWEIGALGKGEAWESEVYSFQLTPDFKDSYLSNTVTVTTAEGEEKTATLTLKIGNPPAPPLKDAVELLIDTLISCYQTHQINQATLTDNGQCLLEKQIPQSAVEAILKSVGGYTYLQCVGLVIAATQMAGQPLEPHHAVDYYGKDFGNWHWHSHLEMDNIREGDIFVSAKSPGHLAVIDFVNIDGFRLAEAFGNSCSQEGPYATLCAGYVRYQDGTFITFHQAKDRGEIGFLRWEE